MADPEKTHSWSAIKRSGDYWPFFPEKGKDIVGNHAPKITIPTVGLPPSIYVWEGRRENDGFDWVPRKPGGGQKHKNKVISRIYRTKLVLISILEVGRSRQYLRSCLFPNETIRNSKVSQTSKPIRASKRKWGTREAHKLSHARYSDLSPQEAVMTCFFLLPSPITMCGKIQGAFSKERKKGFNFLSFFFLFIQCIWERTSSDVIHSAFLLPFVSSSSSSSSCAQEVGSQEKKREKEGGGEKEGKEFWEFPPRAL